MHHNLACWSLLSPVAVLVEEVGKESAREVATAVNVRQHEVRKVEWGLRFSLRFHPSALCRPLQRQVEHCLLPIAVLAVRPSPSRPL